MKKIYMTLAFCALFSFTYAQNYRVVLAVDMNNQTAADVITVAGTFQSVDAFNMQDDWTGASAHTMTDSDGDGIWTVAISVPAGDYQYKFINGADWGENEGPGLSAECGVDDGFGNFNRGMTISEGTTIAHVYDSCEELPNFQSNTSDLSTKAAMTISPNPMQHSARIEVENPEQEKLMMTITDLMGQTIEMNDITNNTVNVDRTNLSSGIYFVTIQNELGAMVTEKLIVR